MSTHMADEIRSQGGAWAAALDAVDAAAERWRALAAREVRLLGAGSSYYLGLAARAAFARRGLRASALPASEQVLYGDDHPAPADVLALAVSRSGTTTETLRALVALTERGARPACITTVSGSPMAEAAALAIEIPAAAERSTVQTRSFSSQLLAALALAAQAADDRDALAAMRGLPERAPSWIAEARDAVEPFASDVERVYLLGGGARRGLALEGALKLKETSLTESEAFHALEFRHGPQSMVDEDTLVVGLLGMRAREAEAGVLREMQGRGARVLVVGPDVGGLVPGATELAFEGTGQPDADLPLYLPPLQLLALARALRKGLDPDHPRNLSFAVELEHM